KHAAANTLSTKLPEFCSAAHLFCFPDLAKQRPFDPLHFTVYSVDQNFTTYSFNENFTTYGTHKSDGIDAFKNYSVGLNTVQHNEFETYSKSSAGHNDSFTNYVIDNNASDEDFNNYGTTAAGGSGEFKIYAQHSNVPNIKFTTYTAGTTGREQKFTSYSDGANAGNQSFTNYGKDSLHAVNGFTEYGTHANVFKTDFSAYSEKGTSAKDTFTSYGKHLNEPDTNFKNYGKGSTDAAEKFTNYRDVASAGDDSFISYGESSRLGVHVNFENYGRKPIFPGTESFIGYAKGADLNHKVSFKGYDTVNNTFKDYDKKGISFAKYANASSSSVVTSGSLVKTWVQPGKFFRERMLKEGTVMPMPDIRDKLPPRSFLPRSILTKLPFASSKLNEMKRVFKVSENSSMNKMMVDALSECERAPSMGETKRCVGSLEDMIDFATSVLGRSVKVRSTENVNGSSKNVIVGKINGGKVIQSVSCHQSLFPYLLYYCHSVPKVRVYEADLLDTISKVKINHGVAICHLDTTAWSPTHGAFLALGSGPGHIEVCHWIFQNDMTWTTAD
ncbi:polygalacturonase non-catalytic protein, partial [Trifolium pratense]